MKSQLKRFLFLTGFSAVGFFISGVLHNVFYALEIKALDIGFFIIAVFLCPLGFIIGVVGSIIEKKNPASGSGIKGGENGQE